MRLLRPLSPLLGPAHWPLLVFLGLPFSRPWTSCPGPRVFLAGPRRGQGLRFCGWSFFAEADPGDGSRRRHRVRGGALSAYSFQSGKTRLRAAALSSSLARPGRGDPRPLRGPVRLAQLLGAWAVLTAGIFSLSRPFEAMFCAAERHERPFVGDHAQKVHVLEREVDGDQESGGRDGIRY